MLYVDDWSIALGSPQSVIITQQRGQIVSGVAGTLIVLYWAVSTEEVRGHEYNPDT